MVSSTPYFFFLGNPEERSRAKPNREVDAPAVDENREKEASSPAVDEKLYCRGFWTPLCTKTHKICEVSSVTSVGFELCSEFWLFEEALSNSQQNAMFSTEHPNMHRHCLVCTSQLHSGGRNCRQEF
ncbi:uncharacterized protein LOC122058415 isoform X2 [Macadamia integrifolia]|uniref:uncharacterized protein LOC122058415 isoform X2 n=2 Tax=Macadamia integrifolia TaxID=60698 RepID=UPI001C529699|nr:uncharacterized protein LOC122058415 isoform X2 [Macadamia integrifolia]